MVPIEFDSKWKTKPHFLINNDMGRTGSRTGIISRPLTQDIERGERTVAATFLFG